MVAIEDLLRLIEIDVVLSQFRPGQLSDRFDVTDDDGIFRAGRRNEIEPFQFALGLREHIGRRLSRLEPGAQLRNLLIGPGIAFAKLLLDRLELLPQISFALRVGKLRRHIFLQLLLDLRDLKLRRDVSLDRTQSLGDVELFENRLLLGNIDIEIGREKIDQLFRVLDAAHEDARPFGRVGQQIEQLRGGVAQISKLRFELFCLRRRNRIEQCDFRF